MERGGWEKERRVRENGGVESQREGIVSMTEAWINLSSPEPGWTTSGWWSLGEGRNVPECVEEDQGGRVPDPEEKERRTPFSLDPFRRLNVPTWQCPFHKNCVCVCISKCVCLQFVRRETNSSLIGAAPSLPTVSQLEKSVSKEHKLSSDPYSISNTKGHYAF